MKIAHMLQLKEKEERLQHTRGACAGLEQKLSKLHTQHETLSKENAALRAQLKNWERDVKAFKAIEGAYQKAFDEAKTYKELSLAQQENVRLCVHVWCVHACVCVSLISRSG